MKRLTLEFPYQELWDRLFGPNQDRVEVLEATKSLKCDFEGLAVICRIRFKDKRMKPADLIGKGAIRSVETLYEHGDGSLVVFIEGKPVVHVPRELRRKDPNVPRPGLVSAGPPEFLDVDRMKVQFLCKDEEVPKILDFYEKNQTTPQASRNIFAPISIRVRPLQTYRKATTGTSNSI